MSIAALYGRGEPSLAYLWCEIARHRAIKGYWCAEGTDLLRLAAGRARFDPFAPVTLPQLPFHSPRSLGLYGAWLRQRADTVILTSPEHESLLPHFRDGRIIYYAVDNYTACAVQNEAAAKRALRDAEDRVLRAADKVVVVTKGLGEALARRVPAIEDRLLVSANAVPADWIPGQCPQKPGPPPGNLAALRRPIAGLLGSISSRLRLDWLSEVVGQTPFLTWLFAGYIEEGELAAGDRIHLARLMDNPNCVFTGRVAYPDYQAYARCLDVAVLPYSSQSVNPLGSAMRLFMHLPFGQPILATPGVAMLDDFVPLVRLCPTPGDLAAALLALHDRGYDDGLRHQRWQEAGRQTWTVRAEKLVERLKL